MARKGAPRRRLRALRVRLRRISPPLRFGAFPFRLSLRAAEPRINSHFPFPGFCLRRPNTEFVSHRVTEGALELARFARSPPSNGHRGEAAYKTNLGN